MADRPEAHLLQTAPWGELKAAFGWRVRHVLAAGAGAQVLFRRLPLGRSFGYLAKGPVGGGPPELWNEIDRVCARERAVFLKWEPDCLEGAWREGSPPKGFQKSQHAIQPPRTILIPVDGSEEDILSRMKQKTRYNIRLAGRRGVEVAPADDLQGFYSLMEITGQRDRFGVHSLAYYAEAYRLFSSIGSCTLLMARFEGRPLAGMMVFARGPRAWYLYGASGDQHRNLMPNYLLQWEAIRWARSAGCVEFDLWGVPDAEESTLEEGFAKRHDGLWGVYRFKRGFGGTVVRAAGPWDRVYQATLYRSYRWWIERRT